MYMHKTFRFRLYPTKGQRSKMNTVLNTCRWVYNKTLETRRDVWKEKQLALSLYDTHNLLTQWRRENKWLNDGHAQTQQNAQLRVHLAFQHFFRRVRNGKVPGYPRFRGKSRYDSFTYPQKGANWCFIHDSHIRLSKIGKVKIRIHRPIEGRVKTLTVKCDTLGNWWACFSCEIELEPLPSVVAVVGVDVGLKNIATLSTGEHIDNPRFFRYDEKALAKAQQKLCRCTKGTQEHYKCKRVVQHIHYRIVNRRRNFAHNLSRQLVNRFQIIAFEDLNIEGMQQSNWRSMNKGIADAAWNQLIKYTTYKAEYAGRSVVLVDPRNTSKMCSGCGRIVEKGLSVRVHSCFHCGLKMDRDLNASLNILARGLTCMGQSLEAPLLNGGNSH